MADRRWFYHHAGRQSGPVSWAELKELAEHGELDPEDMVWQPDWPEWQPAGPVDELFPADVASATATVEPEAVAGGEVDPGARGSLPLVPRSAEAGVDVLGRVLPSARLEIWDRGARTVGHVAYLAAAGLMTLLLVWIGVRARNVAMIVASLAPIPVAVLLDASAARFLRILADTLGRCESTLQDVEALRGVASLSLGCGVAAAVTGLALTVGGGGLAPIVIGCASAAVCAYVAAAVVDPAALNTDIRPTASAATAACGGLLALSKLILLRLAPTLFAAAAVVGAVTVLRLLVLAMGGSPPAGWMVALASTRVLAVAVVPAALWLVFQITWAVISMVLSMASSSRREVGGP